MSAPIVATAGVGRRLALRHICMGDGCLPSGRHQIIPKGVSQKYSLYLKDETPR